MFRVPHCRFSIVFLVFLAAPTLQSNAQDLEAGVAFLNSCSVIDVGVGRQEVLIDHGHLAIYMESRQGNLLGLIFPEINTPQISKIVLGVDLPQLRTLTLNNYLGYRFDCKTPGCIKTAYRTIGFDDNFQPVESGDKKININAFQWNKCDMPTSKKALQGIGAHLIQQGFTLENKATEIVLRAPP